MSARQLPAIRRELGAQGLERDYINQALAAYYEFPEAIGLSSFETAMMRSRFGRCTLPLVTRRRALILVAQAIRRIEEQAQPQAADEAAAPPAGRGRGPQPPPNAIAPQPAGLSGPPQGLSGMAPLPAGRGRGGPGRGGMFPGLDRGRRGIAFGDIGMPGPGGPPRQPMPARQAPPAEAEETNAASDEDDDSHTESMDRPGYDPYYDWNN